MDSKKPKLKTRLDELLLRLGYFRDLKEAQASVMAGRVLVNNTVCSKPGTQIKPDAIVTLRGVNLRYASRSGYKLERALSVFPVTVSGKVVLDAGAACGGFTDCLLQHEAKLIYAVDVGYGQLRGRLATDPRVVNWERTNIGDLRVEDLDPPIEMCVVDLSYLSLIKALPGLVSLFRTPYEIICLVKPLFEGLAQNRKSDTAALGEVLARLFQKLQGMGFRIVDVTPSPVLGTRESVEFLILLRPGGDYANANQLAAKAIHLYESAAPSAGL
jgi:23S rRNA (cytidine1920-2'-O)/16S rRNA (cytidine1409-2'-O)-methyltransferase